MRLFKAQYKGKDGKQKTVNKWWLETKDHKDKVRRFPGYTDKEQSEALGKQIERLIACRSIGEQPDRELNKWLENCPDKLLQRFVRIGLLDSSRASSGKFLTEHIADFKTALSCGNTKTHVRVTCRRIEKICEGCHFQSYSEIQGSKVQRFLSGLDVSDKTRNYYLAAMKQFCKWMVQDGRTNKSPVEHLGRLKLTAKEHKRALTFDEVCRLLEATEHAPKRFGMTGHERAVLYLVAIETGLRVRELQSLTIESFVLEEGLVTVQGQYCKDRNKAEQLLKHHRAEQLKGFFTGKLPKTKAFNMPSHYRTAKMLKADLADAVIPDAGIAFHSLRHTLATALDGIGASLKERRAIMRHSDKKDLTLGTYTHLQTYSLRRVIENLPSYPWPSEVQSEALAATGTDGKPIVDAISPERKNLAFFQPQTCTNSHKPTQSKDINGDVMTPEETALAGPKTAFLGSKERFETTGPGRIRTYNQWIMSPLL